MSTMLECDYLVVGAGACGLAFIDEIIHTTDKTVIVIDKHSKPGGHWNDAYDFVTLHQPAAFYGVNSKQLGGEDGNELATYAEIQTYYELVIKELQATRRVKFYPQCEFKGDFSFRSLVACGVDYKVKVREKIVDATYTGPSVPSTKDPEFGLSMGVHLVPVNKLSNIKSPWSKYVIIGGGKTGVDAVLFLLKNSVPPEHITWIVPNDYWLFNRKFLFTDNFVEYSIRMMNCIVGCESHEELFKRFERAGWVLRIDSNVEPKSLKGGTVDLEELELLRRVKNIVRKGRVDHIEKERIVFENGSEIGITDDTLNVDCTANGSTPFLPKNIFDGNRITLQDVRLLQSVYSASVIAAFEVRFPGDEIRKNKAIRPVFHPQTATDYVVGLKQNLCNEDAVAKEIGMRWLRGRRLNYIHHVSLCSFVRYLLYVRKWGTSLFQALEKMVAKIERM